MKTKNLNDGSFLLRMDFSLILSFEITMIKHTLPMDRKR